MSVPCSGRLVLALLALVIVAMVAASALYRAVVPGLSIARREPPALEIDIATWLLHKSVPAQARMRANPVGIDPADILAGREMFKQKCEVCHAYDGSGRTEIGSGEYPRPPELRALNVMSMTDGEIFYHIRNGIRNTGMPAWQMPDRQIWQLVAYLRRLPRTTSMASLPAVPLAGLLSQAEPPVASLTGDAPRGFPGTTAHYVGSAACKSCHLGIYDRWKQTCMANIVRDPRVHPEAIIPDLTKPDPLVHFSKYDIALVYGSRWKQRYFEKIGDDYFVLPAQWDVTHAIWRPYFVENGADWWATLFPPDNFQRPTGLLCDGCHSVNYDIKAKTVTEWNVGCEKCHGAGSDHVEHPTSSNIVNPARLGYVQANDTCIQCHSQGRPTGNPINGRFYDWPVGFHMGVNLDDYWKLEAHKLGATSFYYFADGTAHKNRMQGNDFVTSLMYARGVTCFSCHDPHGSENQAMLRKPSGSICLDCHGPNTQNGPHSATIEDHTHHKPGSPGSACIACHMPKIEQTIADVDVRSHTFHFVTPAATDTLHIPNACNLCHTDKTTAWAMSSLKNWKDRSPWRMGN
jgi:predicted CXXCH cytochrome family protein